MNEQNSNQEKSIAAKTILKLAKNLPKSNMQIFPAIFTQPCESIFCTKIAAYAVGKPDEPGSAYFHICEEHAMQLAQSAKVIVMDAEGNEVELSGGVEVITKEQIVEALEKGEIEFEDLLSVMEDYAEAHPEFKTEPEPGFIAEEALKNGEIIGTIINGEVIPYTGQKNIPEGGQINEENKDQQQEGSQGAETNGNEENKQQGDEKLQNEVKPETFACQYCDHAPLETLAGLTNHVRAKHPEQYEEFKAKK